MIHVYGRYAKDVGEWIEENSPLNDRVVMHVQTAGGFRFETGDRVVLLGALERDIEEAITKKLDDSGPGVTIQRWGF